MANSTLDMIEARNDHARSSLEDAKSFYEVKKEKKTRVYLIIYLIF